MTAVMLSTVALVGAVLAGSDTVPPEPCASTSRKPAEAAQAFVVTQARSRDTLMRVAVCVMLPKASAARIGSYHGELYFDSTTTRVASVEKQSGSGIRVENTKLAGRVNFAGAAPTGFSSSALLNVVLRIRTGALPRVRLKMLE